MNRKPKRYSGIEAFFWGAAHALDIGGVLRSDVDWRGAEADEEALNRDWAAVVGEIKEVAHGEKARKAG